jgi:hypothetical protein
MPNVLSVHIDGLRTVSEMNERSHWTVRNKRKKEQQRAVYFAWRQTAFGKRLPKLPVVVRLTRFGPRLLDSDNAVSSFKAIRDTVAELLKVDDGDPRISFEYDQRIDSDYAITILVTASSAPVSTLK